jgi:hypothetical protein
MPQRKPVYRRVTPLASRRETQRRAALAVLALIVVVGGLGLGVYVFGGNGAPETAISSVTAGQRAIDAATSDLAKVTGPGIDLVADDPNQALQLLSDAYRQLDAAAAARVSESVVAPLRQRTLAGLDRLYGVVPVKSTTVFTFAPADGAGPIDLRAMVRGPDGVPYVIDRSTKSVYRVDLKTHKATVVARSGQKASGGTVSTPRYLTVGGPDLLILDAKNQLWRWRPADTKGKGTLVRVNVKGSTSWGSDILGIATFLRDQSRGLYNLYVVDPSEQQIEAYSPAADGNGFPAAPTAWLATARDVTSVTSVYVDGDLFAADGGALDRFVSGKNDGWDAAAPQDTLLRPAPTYSIVAGGTDRRVGDLYAFDRPNGRIVAVGKKDGAYHAQYRLAGGVADWSGLRAMYVIVGLEGEPATIVWLSPDGIHQAVLEPVPDTPPASAPSASPGSSGVPSASPGVSASSTPTKAS